MSREKCYKSQGPRAQGQDFFIQSKKTNNKRQAHREIHTDAPVRSLFNN